ncbi:small acid-soluble spore protein Tlp [Bacillus canaveralius]|uniref:Small, acid-soluble spore protein Tlp n=1 Tax=Bacillus canaveralius TaxID=1403243 RepID=A0A2N5GLJ0_9BACI|nr:MULTISPECIES: small acid-soluble spore protein Tlp [Bacillus]PLR82459.1 small acid-soluble spore protein Tlp [Bacillus canaveralius]PLR85715.1 small acid-soluble spore protein Tlp [Bacillus sp. V33-4]PLR95630.1 small acid-soluble spore protein Tlp [Bacillus canaveralius]RSK52853.1 small acid-soluble spore protein Tlp [Bacillus canaveralius]
MADIRPKPDDRSDNVEKLQEMIVNTIENMEEAEATLDFAGPEARAQVEAKNERRRESLDGLRQEVRDEAQAQQNQ